MSQNKITLKYNDFDKTNEEKIAKTLSTNLTETVVKF